MDQMDEEQFDYQKYLKNLQQVKKESIIEEDQQSDEFQVEKQETEYSERPIYHSELDEFVIAPKEQDSVHINTKPYDGAEIIKHKIQPLQLPPLSKKVSTTGMRKFEFKNIEINQSLLKYETVFYEIESYIQEDNKVSVMRQYSDFEWLFEELFQNFPGIIIPAIPSRSVLAKLNLSNYTTYIRAQRQKGLEEFLRKILSHPKLMDCEIVDKFMTYQDQEFKKLMQSYAQQKQAVQKINVGQSILGSIGKISNYFFTQQSENEIEKQIYGLIEYLDIASQCLVNQAFKKRKQYKLENNWRKHLFQNRNKVNICNLLHLCLEKQIMIVVSKIILMIIVKLVVIYQKILITKQFNIYSLLMQIIKQLIQQYLLDFEVILRIIRYRDELQSEITSHAAALNNVKYTVEQKALIQTQLNDHQKNMSLVVENFKEEYERFAQQFNQSFNLLMEETLKVWQSQEQSYYQLWN